MSDLSVTAADVAVYDNTQTNTGTAGATITAGQTVYADSLDSGTIKPADANASTATTVVIGIALHGSLTGQPITYATGGDINPGATVTVGKIYVQSTNAGGIAPVDDLASGTYVSVLGVGLTTSKIHLLLYNSMKAVP